MRKRGENLKMKAWLKGGLIGGGIGILLSVLLFLILAIPIFSSCPVDECYGLRKIIHETGKIAISPTYSQCELITQCSGESCMGCLILGPIIILIELFFIGAIIGKIKSRKKQNEI